MKHEVDNSLATPLTQFETQHLVTFRKKLEDTSVISDEILLDDTFLLCFIRQKKFNVDEAVGKISETIRLMRTYPDFLDQIHPDPYIELYNARYTHPLRFRDDEGRQILLTRAGQWDSQQFSVIDALRSNTLITEALFSRQLTQLHGMVYILDFKGFGLSHIQLFPLKLLKFGMSLMNVTPIQVKAIHIVNNSFVSTGLWNICKGLLKQKMRKRIHIHGSNYESLHKYISSDILPEAYGGKLSFEDAYEKGFIESLFQRDASFKNMSSFGKLFRKGSQG